MGVRHEVLNAKNHEREASIVAQAGRKGMVTVSTNMAGRGTDILLGGNPEFMTKDECLKQKTGGAARARGHEVRRRRAFLLLLAPRPVLSGAAREVGRNVSPLQGADRYGARRGDCARRAAHRGDRAARIAAHRQPVARPRRPPGRPRQLALLPLPAGRPAAHLRRRAHAEPDAAAGHGRGRADRIQADHQAHREGPGSRRDAEFRSPQTPARIRRRQQQAAPGGLRDAPAAARRHRSERAHHGDGARASSSSSSICAAREDKHPDTWDLASAAQRHPQPVRRQGRHRGVRRA